MSGRPPSQRLPLPRGAWPILEARQRGMRPADPVAVSFVGALGWGNPTVYADGGQRYDWRWAAGLPVIIAVRPGVDVGDAIAALFACARLYPALADVERQQLAYVVQLAPVPRLWPMRRGGADWQGVFGDAPDAAPEFAGGGLLP